MLPPKAAKTKLNFQNFKDKIKKYHLLDKKIILCISNVIPELF